MFNNRRQSLRKKIQGIVLVYTGKVEPTQLLDISLNGMKVIGKFPFSNAISYWFEFTLVRGDGSFVFGRRAQAKVTYSTFDKIKGQYILGFQFLSLTEYQSDLISNTVQ